MTCAHESAFSIETSPTVFGPGALEEVGDHAATMDLRRVALLTDPNLRRTPHVAQVETSLAKAGLDVVVYDEVCVEPTDGSFLEAARFAREGRFDGFVSVEGGSVIDTTKAANLYATHPAELLTYVNAPIGDGQPVPGPLAPHIACPTTAGTGSENTGIAVFDLVAMKAKTAVASRRLRPALAIVDPRTTHTLPEKVAASGAFDVLSHALESFTARPYSTRVPAARPSLRPASQGANPWSDVGCREALEKLGGCLVRGVTDRADHEAREQLMWASTLAGIAFGNAGCHVPHGMSYSVSGLVREFQPAGYPEGAPIVPHGMSVIVNAPALFRFTASSAPARHLEGAELLGGDVRGAAHDDAGDVFAARLVELMKTTDMPNGLSDLGYTDDDVDALTAGAYPQRRLMDNAPVELDKSELATIYRNAMKYW